ncbi:hypothetical protein V5N11_021353 [Cardamine amara subsp. amara]|uniref:Uncharacterized protein n=1 Tax=Cardamine amara subsp. amara TaxID=228776 RepID=A0ABD1AU89_CARAN
MKKMKKYKKDKKSENQKKKWNKGNKKLKRFKEEHQCLEVKCQGTPCFKSGQMITVPLLLDGKDDEFYCSFIYASNVVDERKELWGDLKNHQDSLMFRDKPWLIFGGFNEILEAEEHSDMTQSMSATHGMRDFQDVMNYNSSKRYVVPWPSIYLV